MYDEVCYEKPFLKEVIVRVDFSSALEEIEVKLPLKVSNAALTKFPISEPKTTISQHLQLSAAEVKREQKSFTEWNFHGREREKRLVISPATVFITYSKYNSYENLKLEFFETLGALFKEFPDLRASRLGLRYINQIEPTGTNPFEWSSFISNGLLGHFTYFQNPDSISRLFTISEFTWDQLQLKFQFGIPNPDYPAPVRKAPFILDIDGFVQALQDLQDIKTNIENAHDKIQEIFENSITNDLREAMYARPTKQPE